MKRRHSGFTLVEVLVTITIIAVLGSVGMMGFRRAREKSKTVVELNAARNLIAGYLVYAADNNGKLLVGYNDDLPASNLEGEPLHKPLNARYPFRLAPSISQIRGAIFCNENESLLDQANAEYNSSLRPNLGINANFVGGFYRGASLLDAASPRLTQVYGKYYLTHMAEANDPAKLIVFASARDPERNPGYFQVRPPQMVSKVWSSKKFTKDASPTEHGYVDFRWDGKAVVAMLGGNVELLDDEQLRDMRRWSNQASIDNNPDFLVGPR